MTNYELIKKLTGERSITKSRPENNRRYPFSLFGYSCEVDLVKMKSRIINETINRLSKYCNVIFYFQYADLCKSRTVLTI